VGNDEVIGREGGFDGLGLADLVARRSLIADASHWKKGLACVTFHPLGGGRFLISSLSLSLLWIVINHLYFLA